MKKRKVILIIPGDCLAAINFKMLSQNLLLGINLGIYHDFESCRKLNPGNFAKQCQRKKKDKERKKERTKERKERG
jgi:hypothetical protein